MAFTVHVQGDRACFKRIEFAEDLVSYDVITPMAARGLFEVIYAMPDIRWRIDEIRVLRPIRSTWMSLAEADGSDAGPAVARIARGKRDRRMANVLVDVGYVLTAEMELARPGAVEPLSHHAAMFRRRVASAEPMRQPYLGLRGFAAGIAALAPDDPLPPSEAAAGAVDLGWMLYDRPRDGSEGPRLFRPTMIDGVIDLRWRETLILAG